MGVTLGVLILLVLSLLLYRERNLRRNAETLVKRVDRGAGFVQKRKPRKQKFREELESMQKTVPELGSHQIYEVGM